MVLRPSMRGTLSFGLQQVNLGVCPGWSNGDGIGAVPSLGPMNELQA